MSATQYKLQHRLDGVDVYLDYLFDSSDLPTYLYFPA